MPIESLGCCSSFQEQCESVNPSGLPVPRTSAPGSEGQWDLFCPHFLRIQLDMCTLVERTKEGRSYASVEDHLQLQSKAENCKGQGLPKKPSSRSASHAAWLITPVPLALQSGGKTSLTAIVRDMLNARRKLQQHRSIPTTS